MYQRVDTCISGDTPAGADIDPMPCQYTLGCSTSVQLQRTCVHSCSGPITTCWQPRCSCCARGFRGKAVPTAFAGLGQSATALQPLTGLAVSRTFEETNFWATNMPRLTRDDVRRSTRPLSQDSVHKIARAIWIYPALPAHTDCLRGSLLQSFRQRVGSVSGANRAL